MGWLFNALVVRELMKKQDIEPVGQDNTEYQSPKGTIKIFDGANKEYMNYLNYIKEFAEQNKFYPKVLEISDTMESEGLKGAKIVKFELLEPMPEGHFHEDFYSGLRKGLPMLYDLADKPEKATDEEKKFIKELMVKNKAELSLLYKMAQGYKKKKLKFDLNITPKSFMMRGNSPVLVDPFIPKT